MHTGEDVQILTFKRNHLNTTGGFKFGKCVNTLLINRHNCKEKNSGSRGLIFIFIFWIDSVEKSIQNCVAVPLQRLLS